MLFKYLKKFFFVECPWYEYVFIKLISVGVIVSLKDINIKTVVSLSSVA